MLIYLFLLFILLPWLEIAVILRFSHAFGLATALAVIILTGILGATLTRLQGLATLRKISDSLRQGKIPAAEILDAFIIFAAGLLLVTPGFITDSIGFLALVPAVRKLGRKMLMSALRRKFNIRIPTTDAEPRRPYVREDGTIDVQATVTDDDEE